MRQSRKAGLKIKKIKKIKKKNRHTGCVVGITRDVGHSMWEARK
jgi:hypothetical protein